MSMNISGLGNTYNGINTNSKQYKALKEKGWLSGIMQNEAMMSAEERLIYETFGGRDTIAATSSIPSAADTPTFCHRKQRKR